MPSGEVLMAPIEEIIVDRYGQWEASDRRDQDLAEQLRALIVLAVGLDESYVIRRVVQEIGTAPDFDALLNPGGAGTSRP
jgi:hypothetical protein